MQTTLVTDPRCGGAPGWEHDRVAGAEQGEADVLPDLPQGGDYHSEGQVSGSSFACSTTTRSAPVRAGVALEHGDIKVFINDLDGIDVSVQVLRRLSSVTTSSCNGQYSGLHSRSFQGDLHCESLRSLNLFAS